MKELTFPSTYHNYFDCCIPPHAGYSGVQILTKTEPISWRWGIGRLETDTEGWAITLEFEKFFLMNLYVPNAGENLVWLEHRIFTWDATLHEYLETLWKEKPVIIVGDMNVAPEELDIWTPRGHSDSPGFTLFERHSFLKLLRVGFRDAYWDLHPDERKYTWWYGPKSKL